jgi:hypothetical protein
MRLQKLKMQPQKSEDRIIKELQKAVGVRKTVPGLLAPVT